MRKVAVLIAAVLLAAGLCACSIGADLGPAIDVEGFRDNYNAAAAVTGATPLPADAFVPMATSQGEEENAYTTVDDTVLDSGFLMVQPGAATVVGRPGDGELTGREWCAIIMACTGVDENEAIDIVQALLQGYGESAGETYALSRDGFEYEYQVTQTGLFSVTVRVARG